MKYLLITLTLFFNSAVLFAQNFSAPTIRCITTELDGSITVSWDIVSDPFNEFAAYVLYFEDVNGTIEIVKETNINKFFMNYLPTGTPYFKIHLLIEDINGVNSNNSTTFETIAFTVTDVGDENAHLEWNIPSNVVDGEFEIYLSLAAGNFNLIETLDFTRDTLLNEIYTCNLTQHNYKVVHRSSSGCRNESNIANEEFVDTFSPPEIDILNLTVTNTNEATFSWEFSGALDIEEYEILKFNTVNGIFEPLTTITNLNQFTYVDNPSATTFEAQGYKIIPKDDCGNGESIYYYNTLFVSQEYDTCAESTLISWNPFIKGQTANGQKDLLNFEEIAASYEVWGDLGQGFVLLNTSQKGDTSFNFQNIPLFKDLCFYVVANLENGLRSTSNTICMYSGQKVISNERYIINSTVEKNSYIDVLFHLSEDVVGNSTVLYRSVNNGEFVELDTLYYSDWYYQDEDVDVENNTYAYFFELIDACPKVRDSSNISSPILLNVDYDDYEDKPFLSWTPYTQYNADVEQYYITRYVNGEVSAIDSVSSSTLSYTDNLDRRLEESLSTLCYEVTAAEANGNVYGFQELSHSNERCVYDLVTVYIPTGFVVDGKSGDFIPKFTYVIDFDYEFTIFDKWGAEVFRTDDPYQGWNGIYNGEYVPSGVYAYRIFLRNTVNKTSIISGSVVVIK